MKTVLVGVVMLEAAILTAVDFRIDLQVQKDICGLAPKSGSKGLSMSKADWKKDHSDRRLVMIGKSGEKWEEKWIRFIPKEDCQVSVLLMSSSQTPVAFDHIRIEGATVRNGSFEQVDSNNNLQSWHGKKIVLKTTDAADGKNYIEVSQNDRASQWIKCKKGQPVKITFMVRDIKR